VGSYCACAITCTCISIEQDVKQAETLSLLELFRDVLEFNGQFQPYDSHIESSQHSNTSLMTNWVAMPATKKMHVPCRPGTILVVTLCIG
jgi:hypothetical protein